VASIETILKPHVRDLGGFSVRRVLPAHPRQMVGPFIFFDHMGPHVFAPGTGIDVRPHPHIGLATVTYLFAGAILHRDSLGTVQEIRPGDVNWMTAGRGIVHSERSPAAERAAGGEVHGIQTWVALPIAHEETAPAFAHHPKSALPALERPGVAIHVIAGRALGATSPVAVFSDTLYAAIEMQANAALDIPADHEERALYVVTGKLAIGETLVEPGQMAVLATGATVSISATEPTRAMLAGGAKMDGARFISWNFVSSSNARIEQARDDWRNDRFAPVLGETERIPLPD
jgi:redox-sensitive bicupin YhaK (pirin superfamily)